MSYLKLSEHYNNCYLKHGDNHLGVDWPKYEDTITRYQVMYDLFKNDIDVSVLDFGCGLGHFYGWMIESKKPIPKYSGLDINETFCKVCTEKFPLNNFYHKDILIKNDLPNFDYIICNGTFTEKRDLSYEEMNNFFHSILKILWNKTNKGLSFNVMSKLVDWERDDLFHKSMDELGLFISKNLSRNFVIRNDYKLYEYTVYVYK
jgi:SAM-dependent methyltransferase